MAFPDPLGDLIVYLTPLVAPVQVTTRVPPDSAPRPPLVQLRRVGGTAQIPVRDTPRVDVFCWHNTDPEAMDLALAVRAHIWALAGGDDLGYPCYLVEEFLGPRQADDPADGIPRVWATYALTVRADDAVVPNPAAF